MKARSPLLHILTALTLLACHSLKIEKKKSNNTPNPSSTSVPKDVNETPSPTPSNDHSGSTQGALPTNFKYTSTNYGTWPEYNASVSHYGMGDPGYNNHLAKTLDGKTIMGWDETDNCYNMLYTPSSYPGVTSPSSGRSDFMSYIQANSGCQAHPWPTSTERRAMIMGTSLFQHYTFNGSNLPSPLIVGSECGAGTFNWQAHMAFSRGAARMFSNLTGQNFEWIMDFSGWYGTTTSRYAYMTADGNTWCATCGHSKSIRNRFLYMAWMGGTNYIHDESLGADGFNVPAVNGILPLSDFGRVVKGFTDFVAANPDRGTAYVPIAVVINRNHGINNEWSNGKIFNKLAFSTGDWWTYNVFNQILWPSGFNNTVYSQTENQDLVNEPAWGDGVDVVTEDATQTTLSQYPILLVLGDVEQATILPKLQAHLSQGKRVVMSPHLQSWAPYLTSYGGRIYIPGDLATVVAHLNAAYNDVKPFTVSGAVSYQLTTRSDGSYLISLMNNLGVTKPINSSADQTINPAYNTTVTLTANTGASFSSASSKLLGTHNYTLLPSGAISVGVPAGEVTILKLVTLRSR